MSPMSATNGSEPTWLQLWKPILRLFDCAQVDADEQSAVADALNALVTLEKERLHPNLDSDKHSTIVLDLADAAGTTH